MKGNNTLQTYLKSIREIPLLSKEEEKELAIRFLRGDKTAKSKLVSSNLRLVVMAAKPYIGKSTLPFEDLIQEGNIGLMRAIETYDPSLGWRLSTYAMSWIKQAITRAILNNSRTIRLPINVIEIKTKYNKAYSELQEELQRTPSREEIASKMKMPVKKVKEIEELIKDPISLNSPLNDEDDGTIEDVVADYSLENPDDKIDNELLAKAINSVLSTLDSRESEIIILRFGLNGERPQTLDEVGKKYNLTKERIRQIENKALRKLRNPARINKLKVHTIY